MWFRLGQFVLGRSLNFPRTWDRTITDSATLGEGLKNDKKTQRTSGRFVSRIATDEHSDSVLSQFGQQVPAMGRHSFVIISSKLNTTRATNVHAAWSMAFLELVPAMVLAFSSPATNRFRCA